MCMLTASGIIVMKDELNQNSYIQRTIHILYMKKNDRNKTNRNKNQANPKDVAETGGGLLFLIFSFFFTSVQYRSIFLIIFLKKLAGPSTFTN